MGLIFQYKAISELLFATILNCETAYLFGGGEAVAAVIEFYMLEEAIEIQKNHFQILNISVPSLQLFHYRRIDLAPRVEIAPFLDGSSGLKDVLNGVGSGRG